ncbi:MAG: hypothetical protein ACOCNM_05190, partial [Prevotella pectinovora]
FTSERMTCFACGIAKTPNAQIGDAFIIMVCIGLFFANIRYLNNFFLIKSVLFLYIRLYCTKKRTKEHFKW